MWITLGQMVRMEKRPKCDIPENSEYSDNQNVRVSDIQKIQRDKLLNH